VEYFRAQPYTSTLLPKTELKIAVNEDFVEPTINAILKGARTDTGQIGDGKIFVTDLLECIRISDGKNGTEAI
jgi:nitrogen regulatory protein P-II 1